jgi:WD40 repeat protein
MGTGTRLAVTALILSLPGVSRAADPPPSGSAPIAADTALIEIVAPVGTKISIDGQNNESSRELTIRSLDSWQLSQHELTARCPSGGVVSKTLLLRGGMRYRIPIRDPQAAEPEPVIQTGHIGEIWSVAFSPDGKQVLTGSEDHTAIVWDVPTGTMLRIFSGHQQGVTSVGFSPDGKSILTASRDKTAIRDARTGNTLQTFTGCDGHVAFSPDGKFLLMDYNEKDASLWDVATGKRLREFEGDAEARQKRIAAAVAFSADGKRVLTGATFAQSPDYQAALWDSETGELLRTFKGHHGYLASVAFSPDGKSILTGSHDGTSILWDAMTGDRLRTFEKTERGSLWDELFHGGRHYPVNSVAFSPDGNSILTGWGNRAILWDATTGETVHKLEGHTDFVTSVAFSHDGERVLTGSCQGNAILWDASNGNQLAEFEGRGNAWVTSLALSEEGRSLIAGYWNGNAVSWDTAVGSKSGTYKTHQRGVWSVGFSPDGKQMLTGSIDGAILWNTVTKDKIRAFKGPAQTTAFSPDGTTVLTWSGELPQVPILWDAASGARLHKFKGRKDFQQNTRVAFSPDGKRVLLVYVDGQVDLWDMSTAKTIGKFNESHSYVESAAFSPDGKNALTGYEDGTAALWDVNTLDKVRTFKGHDLPVKSVAFSPDGKQIVTADGEQTVRVSENCTIVLWEADTGSKLRTFKSSHLKPVRSPVRSVLFTADGRFVVSGSDAGIVLWDVATGDELCLLISLAGDDWLVVTPEGLFDGSPGGIDKVTYRVENELAVAQSLNKDFQCPGLLARLLKGERPQIPEPSN